LAVCCFEAILVVRTQHVLDIDQRVALSTTLFHSFTVTPLEEFE
jgi:hypothetical protein